MLIVWSKQEMASAIGVTPEYVTKIIKWDRNLSLKKKKELRSFYASKRWLLDKAIITLDNELSGKF